MLGSLLLSAISLASPIDVTGHSFLIYTTSSGDSLSGNIASCVYLLTNRVAPLKSEFRPILCMDLKLLQDSFTMLIIEYILVIRVLALYHQDRNLSIFLKALLSLVAVSGFAFRIHGIIYEGEELGIVRKGVSFCFIERDYPMKLMVASWILPIAYGLTLMGLSLYKAAVYWRSSHGFKGFHLARVLFRDQFIYYGFVSFYAISQLVGAAIFNVNELASLILAAVSCPTTLCILGGQLLINLKEAGERGENGGLNYTPQSVSDIQFVSADEEQQEGV
ncbi:hypothetical protein A7U60_g2255 [Sanghuangporus baumii]|uniref:Uncharacterized protein n=1 Tax=Sanghuangporus baumii TaxID=108892 RepID=A0A9Q5I2J8_SANBA|nr:hypothetical protein A7U60_g2255 [Sanghuangporus baumii]